MTTAILTSLPGLARDRVAALLDWAVAERSSIHLVGPHGIGKTAYIKQLCADRGLRVVDKSLAVCSQRDFCVPVPVRDLATGARSLELLVLDELTAAGPDDRYVLLLDEFSRADAATLNTAMELLQEHTIGGEALPALAAVVALDNPAGDADYHGVGALDLAQADRLATLEVHEGDIPWRRHLEGLHGVDLDGFLTVRASLPPVPRRVLCPRVIDHLLSVHAAGLPAEWALPVEAAGRAGLVDHDGDDVTADTLARLTSTLPVARRVGEEDRTAAAIRHAIGSGWNLRLVGGPGIGKTSHIRAAVEALGFDLEYVSLSQTSLSDLVVPVPVAGRLEFLPAARLVRPGRRYVLVLDEFSRASEETAAAAMELVNALSIAGRRLDGCVAVVALDNPAELGGVRFDAGRIDAAQASRFTATIEVTEDDLPWRDVLAARFPADAGVFLAWRAEDLDDAGRALVSPRCLERMLSLHAAGLDPELGLPVVAGERVPVPVTSLRRRLRGDTTLGLAAVLADLDGTLDRLAAGDDRTELAVLTALTRADVGALRRDLDDVARLVAALHPNHRLSLLRQGGARRSVWVDALKLVAATTGGAA